jgi:hypothetical protein
MSPMVYGDDSANIAQLDVVGKSTTFVIKQKSPSLNSNDGSVDMERLCAALKDVSIRARMS